MERGVFAPGQVREMLEFFRAEGYATLRGLFSDAALDTLDAESVAAQEALVHGRLDARHGTTTLVAEDVEATVVNYVTQVTRVSDVIRAAVLDPEVVGFVEAALGPCWLLEGDPFGVVLQDARPGRESAYTRIGWHSDWQSMPHKPERWPSVAFTFHLDETSPANGFLRVVPGSHLWATPAPVKDGVGRDVTLGVGAVGGHGTEAPPAPMPLGFGKVTGEIPVYCERGDVLFHDCYLWHSAARATDDDTRRRHIRGSWYSGTEASATEADFVKNAAR